MTEINLQIDQVINFPHPKRDGIKLKIVKIIGECYKVKVLSGKFIGPYIHKKYLKKQKEFNEKKMKSSKEEDEDMINACITIQKYIRGVLIRIKSNSKKKIYSRLIHWAKEEKKNIQKEKTMNRNLCFTFKGLGDIGEELALYMYPKSIGGSSKGGGAFDNKEINENKETIFAREIKFVCLEGTKKCKKCKNKCPRFQDSCIFCGNNKFDKISDSRASISAKSHIQYKHLLGEYIIFVMEYNEKNNIINLKCFKFLSNNEYFDKYIKNQHEKGGQNCNFIPYNYDWYLSGPINIINIDIDISEIEPKLNIIYYDIQSIIYENVPNSVFYKEEIEKYNITEKYTKYEDIVIKDIPIRNKCLGKPRGIVTRK